MAKSHKRWRLFADPKIQGGLCLRMVVYWVICQISVIGTICGFDWLAGPSAEGEVALMPAFVISGLILAFVMLDLVVFSNRFAGPMLNLRRKMKMLADNDPVEEISLRPGDFYVDLAENFNRVRARSNSN